MARPFELQGDTRCSVCLSASVTELCNHPELVKGTGGGGETGDCVRLDHSVLFVVFRGSEMVRMLIWG